MNLLLPLYRLTDALRYRKTADVGRRGEDLAHRYLRAKGYVVIARNWRPPTGPGELDIVAWHGPILVFVEVKTRSSDRWSAPERSVDSEKIDAVRRAIRSWLRGNPAEQYRLDVVAIAGRNVEHFVDAVPIG